MPENHGSQTPRSNVSYPSPAVFLRRLPCVLLLAVILMDCSAVNVLQLQDAETMKDGEGLLQGGLGFGPDLARLYYDSSATLGGLYVPIEEFSARYGLSESVEIGGGAWTSALLLLPATSFRTVDLGLRGGATWMITPRADDLRAALTLGSWWYGAANAYFADNSELRSGGSVYGFQPGVILSEVMGDRDVATGDAIGTLYGGLRATFYNVDLAYGSSGRDGAPAATLREVHGWRAGCALFAGYGRSRRGAIEAAAFITQRLDARSLTWSLYAGFRLPIGR